MKLVNYLFFKGDCEQAVEFYQQTLGAELVFMGRFSEMPAGDNPECQMPPGFEDKIMHATLDLGGSELMMCDNPDPNAAGFGGFSISIPAESQEQAEQFFNALSDGGEVQMPLAETFWADAFGMLKDKFGVGWMVNYEGTKTAPKM